ncbi:MAG: BRO family protein [Nostoc sp.]|uniref:BRO-N domain-containing protein n=1 Tax=Nostoc sp. TaxID=1180 RepID=UPI002FFCBB7D
MSNLSVFNFESHEIRFVGTTDAPWFVATDICKALGLTNPSAHFGSLSDKQKGYKKIQTLGGIQELVIVNESGLYRLIFASKKAKALEFQDWVVDEVLPSIRKTGTYNTPTATTKQPTSLNLIDTSKLDALTKRAIDLEVDIQQLQARINTTKAELQRVTSEKVSIAKAFVVAHPDVVKHSLMCSEILGDCGDNKYFSNPLKK